MTKPKTKPKPEEVLALQEMIVKLKQQGFNKHSREIQDLQAAIEGLPEVDNPYFPS